MKQSSDSSLMTLIDVTSNLVEGSGSTVITIDLDTVLESETGYFIQIAATAFDDSSGNSFPGFSDAETWNFTSEDAQPPVIVDLNPADDAVNVGIQDSLVL